MADTTETLIDQCYNLLINLMKQAEVSALEGFNKSEKNIQTKNGDSFNLVTYYDELIEKLFTNGIRNVYPDHKFLGEETNADKTLTNEPTWIIDPIDGTTNYIHKIPYFCISVAFVVNKEIVLGSISNPVQNEFYIARKGRGTFLNNQRIFCSQTTKISEAIYGQEPLLQPTGICREQNIKRMYVLGTSSHGLRQYGSAALSLAHVAKGIIDCYSTEHLWPWDVAAGAILVREAGGHIYNVDGSEFDVTLGQIVCGGTEELCKHVIDVIKETNAMKFCLEPIQN